MQDSRMKLSDWLTKNDLAHSDFAKRVGVSKEAVRLWCLGERKPQERHLVKIVKVTAGKVGLLDFWQ